MADLSSTVCAIDFKNPVMPAAGPNVKSASLMIEAEELGAGGITSKTFSVEPAVYSRPVIKKTLCGGMLNSETWLEDSPDNFIKELKQLHGRTIPLAVSIGYSSEDMKYLGRRLEEEIKPEIIEFSTHYSGSDISPLLKVAESLKGSVSVPVWMKISPGFPLLEELVKAASPIVDGFVAVNSLGPALDFNPATCKPALGSEWGQGWLSGPPLLPIALAIVYRLAGITDKPIIGVGGISTGEDAVKFIMAGASLVQVCTAALKDGPSVYGRIAGEIDDWMEKNNYSSIEQIKGKYRKNF